MVLSELRPSLDAGTVWEVMSAAYRERLGPGTTVPSQDLPGRLGGSLNGEATIWVQGDLTIGLAQRFLRAPPVAFAFLPVHATGFVIVRSSEGTQAWEREALGLAMDAGAVDAAQRETVERLVAQHIQAAGSADEASTLGALRYLTERPASGNPDAAELERYAARLTAADLLLAVVRPSLRRDSTAEDAFRALGARYEYSELTYATDYQRSLADSVASVSRVAGGWGDLARIMTLEKGCDAGAIIETGGELLNRVREPRFLARLQFLLAEAHGSIVSLEQRGDLSARAVPDFEVMRTRARLYYQVAIAGDLDPAEKERAWLYAWGMSNGFHVPPRYDCPVP
jgi:hypothetical protein